MTRTSTFAFATLAALAVASLAPTAVSAHGGGGGGGGFGGGGGHSAAGGFSGSPSSVGHISASGGYAHGPAAASHISRSSVVSRLPRGSNISRASMIARLPIGSAKSGGHKIPTISKIAQSPRMPLPPVTVQTPNHNNPGVAGVVPVDVTTDDSTVTVGAVCVDSQLDATQPGSNMDCNCPIKQYLDDGSVLSQDVCAKEHANLAQ
jgi:hypothetical protein